MKNIKHRVTASIAASLALALTAATAFPAVAGPAWDGEVDVGKPFDPVEHGLTPDDAGLDDPFYHPPAELPAAGQIVRSESAQHLLDLTGMTWPGAATKIMYSSTNEMGATVGVTGFVIEPTVPWPGTGERPTLAIAPGTVGQGDKCAPSSQEYLFATFNAEQELDGLNIELLNAYLAASQGIRVVVTDYIGMGTPGVHTYVNSVDEGNALIDASRAAINLAGAPGESPVGFLGYSQGGGAAASAAERAAGYAPDLNVAGTFAGAPPANLREVLPSIDGGSLLSTLGYAINSSFVYRPDFANLVGQHLNEDGIRFLQITRNECVSDGTLNLNEGIDIEAFLGGETAGLTGTAQMTKEGLTFDELVAELPEVGAYLDAQKLGTQPTNAPIMVENGINDQAIPVAQAEQLAQDYCALGSNVVFYPNQLPDLFGDDGVTHMLPMVTDLPVAYTYLMAAFHGVQMPNHCGSF